MSTIPLLQLSCQLAQLIGLFVNIVISAKDNFETASSLSCTSKS